MKKIGKIESLARMLGRSTDNAVDNIQATAENYAKSASDSWEAYWESQAPISEENWHLRTAQACERVSDAIVNEAGWTNKAVKIASSKLAGAAVPASMFSVAALVGTASTGTAISTLSGAAFTSSALAWIGGSVAVGTVVVSAGAVAGIIAAPMAIKPVADKYLTGKSRGLTELSAAEKSVVDACSSLALGLTQASKQGQSLRKNEAKILIDQALTILLTQVAEVCAQTHDWPVLQRQKLWSAFRELTDSIGFASKVTREIDTTAVGIGTVLMLKLLSEGDHVFTEGEMDILNAIRRSSNELRDMTADELAEHVKELTPDQLFGFSNNVKGIAHELRFVRIENSDADEFSATLFEDTNHPGADVCILNETTGEVVEFQLKATAYAGYVQSHVERYPEIPVLVNSEIAEETCHEDSGISNVELDQDIRSTISALKDTDVDAAFESMAIAATVLLARSVRTILTTDNASQNQKIRSVEAGVKASLIAGTLELLV